MAFTLLFAKTLCSRSIYLTGELNETQTLSPVPNTIPCS